MTRIRNGSELNAMLNKELSEGMKVTAQLVKDLIDGYLKMWYDDYTPKKYERTFQFLNSCTSAESKTSGGRVAYRIYIDYANMRHFGTAEDEKDILDYADKGLHGVRDLTQKGKKGVRFWTDAAEELEKEETIVKGFWKYLTEKGFDVYTENNTGGGVPF